MPEMRPQDRVEFGCFGRFFRIRYSNESFITKSKEMFLIHKYYKYNIDELYSMLPFEYEMLLAFIQEDVQKEQELAKRRQRQSRV